MLRSFCLVLPGGVFSPGLATRRPAWGKANLFESVAPDSFRSGIHVCFHEFPWWYSSKRNWLIGCFIIIFLNDPDEGKDIKICQWKFTRVYNHLIALFWWIMQNQKLSIFMSVQRMYEICFINLRRDRRQLKSVRWPTANECHAVAKDKMLNGPEPEVRGNRW